MPKKQKLIKNNNHFEVLSSDGHASTEACASDIAAALDKHKCRIDVIVILERNKVIPRIRIIPTEIDNH